MPVALVAVVLIPAMAGSLRLVELAGGPHVMPANPRITDSPLPVVVHIICAVPYAILVSRRTIKATAKVGSS